MRKRRRKPLDALAERYGIQLRYVSETGEQRAPSDVAKRAVLEVMGVEAGDEARIEEALAAAPAAQEDQVKAPPAGVQCFVPDWLRDGRAWGITCQLYGLRSSRNHGIGDFEDLARLAEAVAGDGADFVGVNPVHALFTAAPERCSPFSPSSRQFLNPLYIALDRLPGIDGAPVVDEAERTRLNAAHHVDYIGAAALKMGALRGVWSRIAGQPGFWNPAARQRFESFVAEGGESLRRHALFEALSHAMIAAGNNPGWLDWPEELRDPAGEAVRRFAADNAGEVRFHLWLQWLADEQLDDAKERARGAGMRIGLYLDFAVGAALDGSATWSDPKLVVAGARVGAPPDAFYASGQDWGLAPLSPTVLKQRCFEPLLTLIESAARHAGALRIDHAMNIYRLYWIPQELSPADGCYVLYPLKDMLRVLSKVSKTRRTILIGEDLGTVPEGFSETIQAAEIMSCVVLYFEQGKDGFAAAEDYPLRAFVSVSTHDLPPLAAWWSGDDVALLAEIGQIDGGEADRRLKSRRKDRAALLARLRDPASPSGTAAEPARMTPSLAAEIHGFLARTPSRLLGIQMEELWGLSEPVNLPGTVDEYPNWRQRLPGTIEELRRGDFYGVIVAAVAAERPRPC